MALPTVCTSCWVSNNSNYTTKVDKTHKLK